MSTEATLRRVQLQVNLLGAWKTVLHFDASNATECEKVQQGASMLYEASPAASFRIATRDSHPYVLSHMGNSTYGIWIDAKGVD